MSQITTSTGRVLGVWTQSHLTLAVVVPPDTHFIETKVYTPEGIYSINTAPETFSSSLQTYQQSRTSGSHILGNIPLHDTCNSTCTRPTRQQPPPPIEANVRVLNTTPSHVPHASHLTRVVPSTQPTSHDAPSIISATSTSPQTTISAVSTPSSYQTTRSTPLIHSSSGQQQYHLYQRELARANSVEGVTGHPRKIRSATYLKAKKTRNESLVNQRTLSAMRGRVLCGEYTQCGQKCTKCFRV